MMPACQYRTMSACSASTTWRWRAGRTSRLTTIHQPIKEIVASSVELVSAMLDEPDRYPEARLFPCHVVERNTLRPLP